MGHGEFLITVGNQKLATKFFDEFLIRDRNQKLVTGGTWRVFDSGW